MKKIELEIIALSHSITQTHSYAVVLGEVGGSRRLPIVIGGFEAQSIAVAMESMPTGRPLTHDLFKNVMLSHNIELKEVVINDLKDGIFYAILLCEHNGKQLEIDSRTSDALALAVRYHCPIYTYDTILESAGIQIEDENNPTGTVSVSEKEEVPVEKQSTDKTLTTMSMTELQNLLKLHLENEDYEKAALVRDEIKRRSI